MSGCGQGSLKLAPELLAYHFGFHHGPQQHLHDQASLQLLLTALLDTQDELTEHFRCQCGTTRKQHPKTGYSNMFNHVMKRHPDYLSAMKMSDFNSGNLVTFIDQKSPWTRTTMPLWS
ncbi:hypothetical protein GQ600_16001 [Phytophthora cactorum]|nr:hypothetical protein GQ600_16001 [Phytophthora cactorum]